MSLYEDTITETILNYNHNAYMNIIEKSIDIIEKSIDVDEGKNESLSTETNPNTQMDFEAEARQNIKLFCDYLFNNVKSEKVDVLKLRQDVEEKMFNSSPDLLRDLLQKIKIELKKAEFIEALCNKLYPNKGDLIQLQKEAELRQILWNGSLKNIEDFAKDLGEVLEIVK